MMLDAFTVGTLESALRSRRGNLLREAAGVEADLRQVAEEQESEIEERAQEECMARLLGRLDDRNRAEIAAIDAALDRISGGVYGTCCDCGARIPVERLAVVPAAERCVRCTRTVERGVPPAAVEAPTVGALPPDLELASDSEFETLVREGVRNDGRVDLQELRIVCRHGVVHVDGTLPSETERRILHRIIGDVLGVREVVDSVGIQELAWERDDRSSPPAPERPPGFEPLGTEDVVESTEEGIQFVPPDRPPPDGD
jgi:RNA polymerase-binding protein DksA